MADLNRAGGLDEAGDVGVGGGEGVGRCVGHGYVFFSWQRRRIQIIGDLCWLLCINRIKDAAVIMALNRCDFVAEIRKNGKK